METDRAFELVLDFLEQLRDANIEFRLSAPRRDALMVEVARPRERWEVEFFANGSIEVDRFVGLEGVQDASHLNEFWSSALD